MESQATVMEARAPAAAIRPGAQTKETAQRHDSRPWPARLLLLGAALVTGGLLWLSYFPVACGWLAWVALVPLLALVRARQSPRFVFVCAFLGGLGFFVPALWWMHAADGLRESFLGLGPMTAASLSLALYCALYFPAAIFLLRRLDRHLPLPLSLTVPAVWTALEFFRSFFGTGFAWYFLGHSQHDFVTLIQVADLGGAYTVTLLLAAVNAVVFEWAWACPALRQLFAQREPASLARPWLRRAGATGCVLALVAGALVYGSVQLAQAAYRPGPRLALLQGNLEQRLRNAAGDSASAGAAPAARTIIHHYGTLCKEAAGQRPCPDLIVWPETSFPAEWYEVDSSVPPDQVPPDWANAFDRVRDLARQMAAADCGTNLLLGLNTRVLEDPQGHSTRYNSALLIHADGRTGARYDKLHRVPFGEYVPFKEWLPFMDAMSPYDFDYSVRAGTRLTRLALGNYHFGVLICFEDSDPELARRFARQTEDGPAADFLVNLSNDGWFDGTVEHEQHLALCRFRAVEARRSIARAVNMGISALIDANGRVLQPEALDCYEPGMHLWNVPTEAGPRPELPVARWHDFKKVEGVLLVTVPLDDRASLYASWGDWLPQGCWLVVGAGLVTTWVRRRGGKNRHA